MGGNAGGPSPTGNWNTPNVMDALAPRSAEALARNFAKNRPGRTTSPTLREQVLEEKQWATPQAHDSHTGNADRVGRFGTSAGGRNLNDDVANWATPRAEDSQAAGAHGNRIDSVNAQVRIWPTPCVNSCTGEGQHGEGGSNLQTAVGKDWPTPCATDDIRGMNDYDGKRGQTLLGAVRGQPWGTPRSSDYKGSGQKGDKAQIHQLERGYLDAQITKLKADGDKGMLNPDWEETLMGWPVGWTNWTEPCAGLWPGFPMGQGPEQFNYEPPRTMPKGAVVNRTKRIEMIGNGVVWMCAAEAFYELLGGK